jgi:hypothetical protein
MIRESCDNPTDTMVHLFLFSFGTLLAILFVKCTILFDVALGNKARFMERSDLELVVNKSIQLKIAFHIHAY